MATREHYLKLAQSLPPRLIRFFQRYPPPVIRPLIGSAPNPPSPAPAGATDDSPPSAEVETAPARDYPNPFRAQRHAITRRWHEPIFSLRRQADLVKLARKHGVEELLPYTLKGTAERRRRREEGGLRVKGTGQGQKVKGKAWERSMKSRLVMLDRWERTFHLPKVIR